jgi:hypothetical protein
MSQEVELIQLTNGDDVSSVKDRFAYLRGRSVLLVWPEKGTALNRKLDLVLIQREAKRFAIRLALVTYDPDVTRFAAELNISTFQTIGGSARGKWLRGRTRTFANREQRPEDQPQPEELMSVASRVRVESSETPLTRLMRVLVRILLLLVLAALALVLSYLLIPGATVTLVPAQEQMQIQANVFAVTDLEIPVVDVDNGIVPATRLRIEVEERGSIPTSGQQQLGSILSTGSVVFINKTEQAVDIPADLILSTASTPPILFRTQQSAVVSAGLGQQIEVPIEALPDHLGEAGNVDANTISVVIGALADQVDVRNINPTAGGSSRAVRTVTAQDQESLLATLRQQLQTRAYSDMLPNLSDSQFIIPETIRIAEERSDWMVFDYALGDVTDTLTLTMRAVVEAVVVDEGLAQQIVFSQLASQVPRGRIINGVTYQRGSAAFLDDGRIAFSISALADVEAQIDTGIIQERLAGKSVTEAVSYLRENVDIDPNSAPQIIIAPDWFGQMPILPLRIAVRVQEET